MPQLFALLYWITAAAHLAGILIGQSHLQFATKPLLMPFLIGYYFAATQSQRTKSHLLNVAALAFSLAGDVFLMYSTELFFLLGLVSFLITHVLYIFSFRREIVQAGGATLLGKKPWLALPVAALAGGLLLLVVPGIQPEMKIPVIIYSTVITVMVAMALNRYGKVSRPGFRLTFMGALLFMFSDSMIAVNRFYQPFALASFCIMLTYITGQFLIAKGTVKTTSA